MTEIPHIVNGPTFIHELEDLLWDVRSFSWPLSVDQEHKMRLTAQRVLSWDSKDRGRTKPYLREFAQIAYRCLRPSM